MLDSNSAIEKNGNKEWSICVGWWANYNILCYHCTHFYKRKMFFILLSYVINPLNLETMSSLISQLFMKLSLSTR